MAKMFKKQSALKNDYIKIKNKLFKTVLWGAAFILVAIIGNLIMQGDTLYSFGLILTALSVAGFFIVSVVFLTLKSDLIIKKRGIEGEDITADILAQGLSDKYTVFQNTVVRLDGKKSEIDLIVVGDNGVFVIETKNRNGKIEGGYNTDRWMQYKVGQKGGEYSSDFYSPVKQVSTHVFRLAGYLRQNDIRVYINGIVYFPNEDATLILSGQPDKIPVFQRERDLLRFISKNQNPVTNDTIAKICNLLK